MTLKNIESLRCSAMHYHNFPVLDLNTSCVWCGKTYIELIREKMKK